MQLLVYWRQVLEVALLWYFIYMAFILIKGTRTEQLLKGIILIVVIYVATQQLGLEAINWVMTRLFPISIIALLVIFQPEMRRALAQLGQFGIYIEESEVLEEIAGAAIALAKKRIGALIVIEREVGLKTYIESGVAVDANVNKELITSIFMPQTILHDGAMIIKRDRIVAAGCLLPLTQETRGLSRSLGTRHRAAIGVTEETDAVSVVVSEEFGTISVSVDGKLTRNLEDANLVAVLNGLFYRSKRGRARRMKVLPEFLRKVFKRGS